MISETLVKAFVKDSENTNDESVRNRYGFLAGAVGIASNLVLFIVKFSIGFLSGSVAVTADAFNNFTDMASSIITIAGFKLAGMPADEEHPFGHGRLEYISALVVAFMVMFVGAQFTKTSVERIMNPSPIEFQTIPFVLLLLSIAVKLWLSVFNKYIGNKIDSSALKAVAMDALGDVFTSSCVVISFLAARFTDLPIDGYVGVAVSLAILYAGFSLVKETINPLLGEAPDPEIVSKITENLMKYEIITGVHDLIIHNYGVGRCIASVHAEVPAEIDVMDIHEVIDDAEKEISEKMNIHLVIHMDPICLKDEELNEARAEIEDIISAREELKSIHDLRIVGKGERKNLVFDVVVDPAMVSHKEDDNIKKWIDSEMKKRHGKYNCIIVIDRDYAGNQ